MKAIIAIVAACFLWSIDLYIRTPVEKQLPVSLVLVLEYGLAFFVFMPFFIKKYRPLLKTLSFKNIVGFIFVGAIGSSAGSFLLSQSVAAADIDTYAFVQIAQPLLVIWLATIFLKEQYDQLDSIWFFWIILSVTLINFYDFELGNFVSVLSNAPEALLYSLMAALIWGASTICGKILLKKYDPFFTTYIRWFFAFLAAFLFAILNPPAIKDLNALTSLKNLGLLLPMSLVTGFGGMWLYYYGLSRVKASSATFVELFYPIFSILLTNLFSYRNLGLQQLVGISSFLLAIYIKMKYSELPRRQTDSEYKTVRQI